MKPSVVCYFDSNQSLEWDSLADIGYYKIKPTETCSVSKKREPDLIDNYVQIKDKNVNYSSSTKVFERHENWRETLNSLRKKYGNHLKDNNGQQIIPEQTGVLDMQNRSNQVTQIACKHETKVNQENPIFQKISCINDHTSLVKSNTFITSYEELQLNVKLAVNILCLIFESKSLSRRKKKLLVDKVVKKILHCNISVHKNQMKTNKPIESKLTTSSSKLYSNQEILIRNQSPYNGNDLNDGNINFTSLYGQTCKNLESEKPFQRIRKYPHALRKSEINYMKPCIVDFKKGGEFIPSVCQANNIKKVAKQSPNCSHSKLANREYSFMLVDSNWQSGSSRKNSDYIPDEESMHTKFKYNLVSKQNISNPSTCSKNNELLNSSMYTIMKKCRKSNTTLFETREEKRFPKEKYIGTRSCRELLTKRLQSKSDDFYCLYNSNDQQGSYVTNKIDTRASGRNKDAFCLRQKVNSSKNYQSGTRDELSSMHSINALDKTSGRIGTSSPDTSLNVIFARNIKASPLSSLRNFPLKVSIESTESKNFAHPVHGTINKSEKKNVKSENIDHVNKTGINKQTQVMRQPVTYILIFGAKSDWKIKNTLRDHLEKNRPDVVKEINFRQSALRDLQTTRNIRNKKIREIFEIHPTGPISRKLKKLPPPIRPGGIFGEKEMKDLTSKRFGQLSEIIQRVELIKKENENRTNKLIANIFSKRLQKLTHKGIMSIEHYVSII